MQSGFGALRTSYEALVIFELFNDVVRRFEERISFERLKKVCAEQLIIEQIVARTGQISRYIDAHLHSDAFTGVKPTPEKLLEEIDAFEELKKSIKEFKK